MVDESFVDPGGGRVWTANNRVVGGAMLEKIGDGGFDLGARAGWTFANPYWVAFTWTKAECDGDASSDDPESLFAGCMDGNDVPYIPEFQVAAGAGLAVGRFGCLYLFFCGGISGVTLDQCLTYTFALLITDT